MHQIHCYTLVNVEGFRDMWKTAEAMHHQKPTESLDFFGKKGKFEKAENVLRRRFWLTVKVYKG
jgi:hypothetical protein